MTSLARQILDSRRPDVLQGRPIAPPRPDHLLIGPAATPFVLRLADSVLQGAPAAVRAIAWAQRPLLGPAPGDDEGRELFECAARLGVPVLAPVSGACEPAYREALAGPGRVIASCAIDATACGALSAYVWRVSSLEAVALLCGATVTPGVLGDARLVLSGSLAPGVAGVDVALEFARRADLRPWAGRVIEVSGSGVTALGMGDRIALARTLARCGAEFVLLPSDDITRAALRAWGRDADWRELLVPDSRGEPHAELDLDGLEPLVAPAVDPTLARPLRHALEHPLQSVSLGPFADEEDVATWMRRLAGRHVAEGIEASVHPGTTGFAEALAAGGERDALFAAGVVMAESSVAEGVRGERGERSGTRLGYGQVSGPAGDPDGWLANPLVCAASALTGALADPRDDIVAVDRSPRRARVGGVRPPAATPLPEGAPSPPPSESAPLAPVATSSLRAIVWLDAGDDCASERVVSRSARARRALLDDPIAGLFPGHDRAWTRLAGGGVHGVIVAGRNFGDGVVADEAAWALRRAGVAAVVARSFAPEARHSLVFSGVLPLEAGVRPLSEIAAPGDELEFPSLPEGVEPGHPVGVRNLTRGLQDTLVHRLGSAEIAVWRAGGLLARAEAPAA